MSKNDEIKLSKKYGVNPTMCKCFFCGEVKHIALMGHIGDYRKHEDIEAPHECIMDYEPCDSCTKNMYLGVTLIEVTTKQPKDNRPPLKAQGGVEVYPLGRWCVLSTEAVKRMFNYDLKNGDKMFVDSEVMTHLLSNVES